MKFKNFAPIGFPKILSYLLSIIVIILGAIVLFGWYTNKPTLIQINPAFVPMQYNTALGFLLSGLMLLFVLKDKKRISTYLSLAVLLIGFFNINRICFQNQFDDR